MIHQNPKAVIDVGEIGNASTGDILYDGGIKINSNFDAVYNAFADQRLFETNSAAGAGLQKIHATGYYQKAQKIIDFQSALPVGSMWDIDTALGTGTPVPVTVTLPTDAKRGEGLIFANFRGNIGPNSPLVIRSNGSWAALAGDLRVTTPFVRVECWCISDESGQRIWDYSITSLFGRNQIPLDKTFSVGANPRKINIADKDDFNVIKLLLTATDGAGTKVKSSEVNLFVDTRENKVFSTEYASMRIGAISSEDEIYDADYSIDASNNQVILTVKSTTPGLRLAVKTINTQKIGVPI